MKLILISIGLLVVFGFLSAFVDWKSFSNSKTFLGNGYIINKETRVITWNRNQAGLGSEIIATVVPADFDSFQTLNFNTTNSYPNFGRDKDHVFIADRVIKEADSSFRPFETEKLVGSFYKGKYYRTDSKIYLELEPLAVKDPKSFELMKEFNSDSWAKDDFAVYYSGEVIEGADSKTMRPVTVGQELFNQLWARDNRSIYWGKTKLKESDPESFAFYPNSEGWLAHDNKHVFFWTGMLVEGADLESFIVINQKKAKDKINVYDFNYSDGNWKIAVTKI